MVLTPKIWRDAIALAALLGIAQAIPIVSAQKGFLALERAGVSRLSASVEEPFERAQESKDDLAAYRLLGSLLKIPGVVEAKVSERGTLRLVVSDALRRKLLRDQFIFVTITMSALWVLLLIYRRVLDGELLRQSERAQAFEEALQTERHYKRMIAEREMNMVERWKTSMRTALSRIPEPTIVLDRNQRVIAINQAACTRGRIQYESAIGRSWHELSCLRDCGDALDRSLAYPGQKAQMMNNDSELIFYTDEQSDPATWIQLSSA